MSTTESVAHVKHNRAHRLEVKQRLKRSPIVFTGEQAVAISKGFAEASNEGGYELHACAILPEHCHLIIGRHERPVGQISAHLKGRATQEMKLRGLWTSEESPWGVKYWAVFIDEQRWMHAAIRYVQNNPMKEGKRPQRWSFVQPYQP